MARNSRLGSGGGALALLAKSALLAAMKTTRQNSQQFTDAYPYSKEGAPF
jgi:hypothetical protein